MDLKKCERCKHYDMDLLKSMEGKLECKCEMNMPQFPMEDEGECEKYDSKYIEYPLTINGIDNKFDSKYSLYKCGTLVKIRPCKDEYKGKTFLGILLGELPTNNYISYDTDTKMLKVSAHRNPAIFIPDLKKIIYGCERWWGEIKTPEDLKSISDKDIDSIWYVQLLKGMSEQEAANEGN